MEELSSLIKALEQYPAILALLFVVYLLFRIILAKDVTMKELITLQKEDLERTTKLTTLLEILISRKEEVR